MKGYQRTQKEDVVGESRIQRRLRKHVHGEKKIQQIRTVKVNCQQIVKREDLGAQPGKWVHRHGVFDGWAAVAARGAQKRQRRCHRQPQERQGYGSMHGHGRGASRCVQCQIRRGKARERQARKAHGHQQSRRDPRHPQQLAHAPNEPSAR